MHHLRCLGRCEMSSPRGAIVQEDGNPTREMFVWMSTQSDDVATLKSSGVTGDRPIVGLFIGRTFFDTTLGIPIWYSGTNWKNSAGTTV